MPGKRENKKPECGQNVFKHYKVMVKILQKNQVEYQNLEIFTTGLPQLLEMRRIHNKTFEEAVTRPILEVSRSN